MALADVRQAAGSKLPNRERVRADAVDPRDMARLAKGTDAAVLAVPSAIVRRALANLIDSGIPTADISFTPELPLDLARRARAPDVSVVLDCELALGLSHVLAAAAHRELGGLGSLRIYVGGIPRRSPQSRIEFRREAVCGLSRL
ncbi:MAG TPA: hypothetical protein VI893_05210 [Thermoplasmata archaeon]|nr:hypothetical protein [Thermoplasmata archaeon]